MRIVTLLTDLLDAIGGIQTFNRALALALDELAREKGWAVSSLVLNDARTPGTRLESLGMTVTRYAAYGRHRGAFAAAALRHALRAQIVILGHVKFASLAPAMQVAHPSLKTVLAVYGIDVTERLPLLDRLGARSAKAVLSISASTRDQAVAMNGLNPSRFTVFPCTLGPSYGDGYPIRSRKELGLPDGPMILSVSRLDSTERYKKIDVLLAAMKSVIAAEPKAFCVVVGDGPLRPELEQLASGLAIRDRVVFTGNAPPELLPSYYKNADVFALPSLKEGFGIVFLEAMYYAKPCVGARASAVPEVIEEGKTGLLAAPGDPSTLAAAIARLLGNSELRNQMGVAGKERLDREFSPAAFKRRLETALLN